MDLGTSPPQVVRTLADQRFKNAKLVPAQVIQAEVRRSYEWRRVRWTYKSVARASEEERKEIDRWRFPAERIGTKVELPEYSSDVHCEVCLREGRVTCPECQGQGYRYSQGRKHTKTCAKCQGTGKLVCDVCCGTAAVRALPSIEYDEKNTHRMLALLPDGMALPLDSLDIFDKLVLPGQSLRSAKGRLEARIRADDDQRGEGGYRGSENSEKSPMTRFLERVLADEDNALRELVLQTESLEVRRCTIWEAKNPDDNATLGFIYGDPPQSVTAETDITGIVSDGPLRAMSRWFRRIMGWS